LRVKVTIHGREYAMKKEFALSETGIATVKGDSILVRIPRSWPREEAFRLYLDLVQRMLKKMEKSPEKEATWFLIASLMASLLLLYMPFSTSTSSLSRSCFVTRTWTGTIVKHQCTILE